MSAQHEIDKIVLDTFGSSGVFVEAGGSDPKDQSNTWLLEEHGWSGLIVEPNTSYNELYKSIRPKTIVENYALVDRQYSNTTVTGDFTQEFTGKIDGGDTVVNCCTLDSLLQKHQMKEIHFLSLDVEGYETQVIDGIDFDQTFIHLIVLENHTMHDPNYFDYLEKNNFKRVHMLYSHEYFMNNNSSFKFQNNYFAIHRERYLNNRLYFKNKFIN